jgi:hypothetical protein
VNRDQQDLLRDNREKLRATLRLFMALLDAYVPFDPAAALSPKKLEPYDAMADRFILKTAAGDPTRTLESKQCRGFPRFSGNCGAVTLWVTAPCQKPRYAPPTCVCHRPATAVSRFIRAVESALRLFRSVELHEFGVPADSTRELLDRMEKLRWVSSADLWLAMRSIRNKIVHDYLPEQVAQMFQ